jgi:membrane protease subunit HflC
VNRVGFFITSILLALALLSSMLFVVDQRQFGVVYALGQIKEVITEPGLNIKLPPPFQNVRYIDKRLLTLDSTDTEPMLTAESSAWSSTGTCAGVSAIRPSTSGTWASMRAQARCS